MPLISAAIVSGIISRLGAVPVLWAMRSATGMKIATTPVELITEPSAAHHSISSTSSRVSLLPALRDEPVAQSLRDAGRTRPSPITNSAAISTMFGVAEAGQRLAHA